MTDEPSDKGQGHEPRDPGERPRDRDRDKRRDRDRERDRSRDGGGPPHDMHMREPPGYTGQVLPADPELTEWLERLWTRNTPPDRLELWCMAGTAHDVRRGLVFFENFRPGQALNIEQCARLCGEMLQAAQNWADSKRRLSFFEIAITNLHQPTTPLCRPIGPMLPRHGYGGGAGGPGGPGGPGPGGMGSGGMGGGMGDEDDPEDVKVLTHKYLRGLMRLTLTTMRETHMMMGQFMQIQQTGLLSQGSHVERLQNANMSLHDQTQTAQDRSTERSIWVEREKVKMKAIQSGLNVGTNLLYGWFGVPDAATGMEGAGADGKKDGAAAPPARRHPVSAEQRLVASFLEEAADEKLSVQLFGDWKDTERLTLSDVFAGLGLEKPGIFTPQQFGIFIAVRDGVLGPEALDALLHDSGKPAALTLEQMVQAQPLITQSMLVALTQIRELRLKARARLEAQGAAPAPTPAAPQGESS